jgi:hypothetical protein
MRSSNIQHSGYIAILSLQVASSIRLSGKLFTRKSLNTDSFFYKIGITKKLSSKKEKIRNLPNCY